MIPMTGHDPVSQKTIANALNIGKTTVSLALANHPRIPKKTRDQVHEMARTLGYKPHPLFADLAKQRWRGQKLTQLTVGFIGETRRTGGMGNFYSTSQGVLKQAGALGYHVEIFFLDEYRNPAAFQKMLLARGIQDLIFNGVLHQNVHLEMDWDRFVTVFTHSCVFPTKLHAVVNNHYGNIISAWKKAVELGYTRIGAILLNHGSHLVDDELRMAGMMVSQQRFYPELAAIPPLELDALLIPWGSIVRDQISKWVRKNRPDAIIGFQGGYHFHLRHLGYDSLGFINLHLPYHRKTDPCCSQAGMEMIDAEIGAEAVNLLHMCRKTNQWGIPARRIEHVIDAQWRDGYTLPPKITSLPHRRCAALAPEKIERRLWRASRTRPPNSSA